MELENTGDEDKGANTAATVLNLGRYKSMM